MNRLIHIDRLTTRIRDRVILENTSWMIEKGQNWAVIGPNGSGKTSLMRVLTRELPVISGKIHYSDDFLPERDIALVSFESEKRLFLMESRKEDARQFSGRVLDFTQVNDVLSQGSDPVETKRIVRLTGVENLLKRNITRLSTGEFRKVLIARSLLNRPRLLLLDEPLEGLDMESRNHLTILVDTLIKNGVQVIMVTHRTHAIPSRIENVLCLKNNRVHAQGKREDILDPDGLTRLYGMGQLDSSEDNDLSELLSFSEKPQGNELIRMDRVTVTYGNLCVFKHLSWQVNRGEKWMVTGPNGSGKSTLLSLISGDNPQAYANEIYLFGKRRGSGESIWDIKKRIGLVSSEFQLRYQRDMTLLDVILSGFFDSVGLYRKYTIEQKHIALAWLRALGFQDKSLNRLTHLSFGEQKLVLIARAMVKSPEILILDEPCQGLDPANRRHVLALINRIGSIPGTTIIHVSHHREEILPCIDKYLAMGQAHP